MDGPNDEGGRYYVQYHRPRHHRPASRHLIPDHTPFTTRRLPNRCKRSNSAWYGSKPVLPLQAPPSSPIGCLPDVQPQVARGVTEIGVPREIPSCYFHNNLRKLDFFITSRSRGGVLVLHSATDVPPSQTLISSGRACCIRDLWAHAQGGRSRGEGSGRWRGCRNLTRRRGRCRCDFSSDLKSLAILTTSKNQRSYMIAGR